MSYSTSYLSGDFTQEVISHSDYARDVTLPFVLTELDSEPANDLRDGDRKASRTLDKESSRRGSKRAPSEQSDDTEDYLFKYDAQRLEPTGKSGPYILVINDKPYQRQGPGYWMDSDGDTADEETTKELDRTYRGVHGVRFSRTLPINPLKETASYGEGNVGPRGRLLRIFGTVTVMWFRVKTFIKRLRERRKRSPDTLAGYG